jgi:hypothetical protein
VTKCTNCGEAVVKSVTPQQTQTGCSTIISQTVCVQGTVTITPNVVDGPSQSFCVGEPMIGECPGTLQDTCSFTVNQRVCVQIPLTFSATGSATPDGLVCDTPIVGTCPGGEDLCTFSIGHFRDNTDFTNQLITDAGGSIVLGTNSDGLSFTVTTANANDVLNFNTPSPPAPANPPFEQQYQVLYAQLLAANLNVLNLTAMGFEICDFATDAITAANNFLATSPAGGMAGAPAVQEPLAQFNEGNGPGCPPHCEEESD